MIILILIIGLILRLVSLNQSLWLDEAINVTFASKLSLFDFLTKYTIADFHPPGYFFILWIWIKIFGNSEIVVRLPSVLFGVATIYLTYLIGKNLFSKKVGLLSSALLAVAPLHLYYSQEARMYSMAAFAVTLSFYFLIQLTKNNQSRKNFIWYILSISLILYSDYLAYLILPVQLFWIFSKEKKIFKKVFFGQFIGGLFLVPWLFIFPSQLLNGQQTAQLIPGWRGVVGGAGFKDLGLVWIKILIGRISFENKFFYGTIIGLISLFYGIILLVEKLCLYPLIKRKDNLLIWCWLVFPIVLAFLVSFYIPILSYFRLIFIIPALTLLLAVGLEKLSSRYQKMAIVLVILINLICCLIYLFDANFQREDWRGAVRFLEVNGNSQSIVLFENNDVPAPFSYYYQNGIDAQGALLKLPANSSADIVNLEERLKNKSKVYLVDYLVDITDPHRLVAKILEQDNFHLAKTDNFDGVGFVYEYSR